MNFYNDSTCSIFFGDYFRFELALGDLELELFVVALACFESIFLDEELFRGRVSSSCL
jgi:hypothetical protein